MSATENLLIGAAKLFIAAAGTEVDDTDVAALKAGTAAGWTYLGETTAPVTLNDNPEYARATSQQSARTLDVAVTRVNTTLGTTLREVTATALASWVRGQATTASGVTTVTPGGLGSTPKFAVALVGPWPGGDALVTATRCAYTGSREIGFSSEGYTEVAIEVEVLDPGFTVYTTDGAGS
jgi:hypothetical protein